MNRASASPLASTRPRAGGARARWLTALAVSAMSACSLSQNGVLPPGDTFFYPTSAVMNPADTTAGQWLYVANSNADLRFNDGTLVMANVGQDLTGPPDSTHPGGLYYGAYSDRTTRAGQWSACPQEDYVNPLPRSDPQNCCWDLLDKNILNCDERRYIQPDATVLIGSFAAQMAWQQYCDDPCLPDPQACLTDAMAGRIFIGVRGDTSLTDVDVAPPGFYLNNAFRPAFHCTLGTETLAAPLTECDQKVVDNGSSLPVLSQDPPTISLPDEPYALTIDDVRDFLYVGHLVGTTSTPFTGGVSLFDISRTGLLGPSNFPPRPTFIAPFDSPFPASSSGFFGVTALDLHVPLGADPASDKVIFASSRYVPVVSSMTAIQPSPCSGADNDDVLLPAGDTLSSGLVGSEMRGTEFIDSPTGTQPSYAQRVYTLQRIPPDLVGFDIAKNEAGGTIATPTDVSETCSSPTFLYKHNAGDGDRLFVNCFDTGEVYIFDPAGPTLMTTLQVGRGPAGMFFDPARPIAYVVDFSQNDLSVVDLTPESTTQYHVIQRLGFPSVTPR
jgi:hypothetical protein